MNNYTPLIFSIMTMLMKSSKNNCVIIIFLMRTRLKRYIKSLTEESIKLYRILNLKTCKSPFKFTWNAPLENENTAQWGRSVLLLRCCPHCGNIVTLNFKHFSNLKKTSKNVTNWKHTLLLKMNFRGFSMFFSNHKSSNLWNTALLLM